MSYGLRDLAEAIDRLAKEHAAYDALASRIVQCCVDHLCTAARVREQNEKIHQLERSIEVMRRLHDSAI